MTSMAGARSTAAMRARWISAPVASPPAWAMRSRWWPPSRVSDSSPSGWWSKTRAERDQLAHGVGPLGHQDAHGVLVAGTGAGDQGVVQVLLGGVPGPEGGGDAALGPLGRAGVEDVLGDDEQRTASGSSAWMRSAAVRPGDAGADHHDVGPGGPAGVRGPEALRERLTVGGDCIRAG